MAATRLLDRLASTAGDPTEVAAGCHNEAEFDALPVELQGELTTLLGYELNEVDEGTRVRLTPQTERDGWWAVRPYEQTPPGVPEFWSELLGGVNDPLLAALLSDLLLSTRTNASAEHAARTVKHYLEVAERPATDSLHAAMSVIRAAAIARSRRMGQERDVWTAATSLLERQLRSNTPPGGPARLFDILARPPVTFALTPDDRLVLSRLFDSAEEVYPHANAADWIADGRRRIAEDADQRLSATNRQVERYLAAADDADGLVRMHWASRAAEIAKSHGAEQGYEAAVRVMQSIPHDAMGWQSSEVTIPVPTAAIRHYIRRVARADGWQQALAGFLASPSPSGSYERNRKTALAAAEGSIRALFSTTVFGAHGLPEQSSVDFEENEILRTEQFAVGTHGILLNEELREIRRRFGGVAVSDVAIHMMERFGCNRDLALEFAQALDLFWIERYSDAARLSIPLIEAGARGLLLRLDEAIYRVERGKSPGRFPAMDFYLDRLAELDLDHDWVRALRVVLLSPGMNTRNLAAHGFKFTFRASDAAILLRLAGLFCALPADVDAVEVRSQLPNPLATPRKRLRRRLAWVWQ